MPQQIGSFKIEKHQQLIKTLIKDNLELNFNEIWTASEQWILH
jgi:hypothetical protein